MRPKDVPLKVEYEPAEQREAWKPLSMNGFMNRATSTVQKHLARSVLDSQVESSTDSELTEKLQLTGNEPFTKSAMVAPVQDLDNNQDNSTHVSVHDTTANDSDSSVDASERPVEADELRKTFSQLKWRHDRNSLWEGESSKREQQLVKGMSSEHSVGKRE